MRGKQYRLPAVHGYRGITPADAGKTYTKRETKKVGRDHPRGCGENNTISPAMQVKLGSPPRMRGKHGGAVQGAAQLGITPADAGKTPRRDTHKNQARDHPRGCGENSLFNLANDLQEGSPPRMRGKPFQCAALTRLNWDHPRGCGENLPSWFWVFLPLGSPPRMRGKLISLKTGSFFFRITPADAGKTKTWNIITSINRDHPRGCGENRG